MSDFIHSLVFGLITRAAEKGNFEAAVKLGIAYLYNEGRRCFFSSFFFYNHINVNQSINHINMLMLLVLLIKSVSFHSLFKID